MSLHIGIAGWQYQEWRGPFYPKGVPQRRELEYASRQLSAIEINGSFYSLQRPESYARWRAETPDDFVFSVKGPRFITHILRLAEVETPLANFFASGLFNLREKLGPILWQFAPSYAFDPAVFEAFLALLPHDTDAALALAKRHDDHVAGRTALVVDKNRAVRHAIEIRNKSFANEAFVALLRRHSVAIVVADSPGTWPYLEDVTADFVYMRMHGKKKLYESGYTEEALEQIAARIRAWRGGGEPADAKRLGGSVPEQAGGRDVYCYFDNDAKARAPLDAMRLMEKLGVARNLPLPAETRG
jgi:uncharacterized protein YecE (DUF72 family)